MNCLNRKQEIIPQCRFRTIAHILVLYGLTCFTPVISIAKTRYIASSALDSPASPVEKWRQGSFGNKMECDTAKKDTSSNYKKFEHNISTGKVPFFETWTDYFSSHLTINRDSIFNFSWGYNGRSCWTTGKWERKKDTFYFKKNPDYILLPGQNDCPLPDKLCFYNFRLYLLDSSGNLKKGKIPSPYMGKKSPLFKTLYFRDKRYNLHYFDSTYYQRTLKNPFRFGFGVNVMLQPVPGFATSVSVGFVFSPRYIFARKENSYLSLGMPFTLGLTGFSDSLSIEPYVRPMVDIPLIFNYNHALGNTKQGWSRFEYFIGGGVAYHYNEYKTSENPLADLQKVNGFGAVANAGIRFSRDKYRVKNFELKFSYEKMIVASKADVFGIGLIVNVK